MNHKIRDFRGRMQLSQVEFAKLLDTTQSAISEIEKGDRYPTYLQISEMFKLGATVEELFGVDCSKACPKVIKEVDYPQLTVNSKQDGGYVTQSQFEVLKSELEAMRNSLGESSETGRVVSRRGNVM